MADEPQRLAERLELIEGIVWACEHGHALLDIMMRSRTHDVARAEIMRVAGVTELVSEAIANTQTRYWVEESADSFPAERDDLRGALGLDVG